MLSCLLFAYLGPETLLPMTSVVATVAGVVLMFGKNVYHVVAGVFRTVVTRAVRKKAPMRPHVLKAAKARAEASASRP